MLTRALYFVLLLSTTSDRSKIVIFLVIVVGCLIAWPFVANASNNNLKGLMRKSEVGRDC